MTKQSSSGKASMWSAFYQKEQSLYDWLNVNAIVVLDINASSTMYDRNMVKQNFGYELRDSVDNFMHFAPPQYIRKCITFSDLTSYNAFQASMHDLRDEYRTLTNMAPEDKVWPSRFPVFIDNAIQLTYSSDSAFSAKVLPESGDFVVIRGLDDQFAQDAVARLHEHGIDAFLEQRFETFSVKVDIGALRAYWNCRPEQRIHARRPSGVQYTARIRTDKGTISSKLGFFVFKPDGVPTFYRSVPRKKRSDTIQDTAREVFLPVSCNFQFFIKPL
ncbi:hypothetical protein OKZ62_001753 [Vibrio navarrensis]|nr:hypothetical protein [Vibrio navarrensis]